jgi:hypothetical protein
VELEPAGARARADASATRRPAYRRPTSTSGPPASRPPRPRLMMWFLRDPRAHPPRAAPQTLWSCRRPAGQTTRRVPRRRRPRASVTARHSLNSPPRAPRHPLLIPVHAPAYKKAARAPPRAHAALPPTIVAVAASMLVHPPSPSSKQLDTSPRTHGSCHGHLFARIRPPLAGTRAGAEAPPRPRRRHPPAASPTQPPPRIDHW